MSAAMELAGTIIERAARALVVELERQDGGLNASPPESVEFESGLRLSYIDQNDVDIGALVRVVLQAIREPTEAMHDAGSALLEAGHGYPHDRPLPTLRNAYKAMIDAALADA